MNIDTHYVIVCVMVFSSDNKRGGIRRKRDFTPAELLEAISVLEGDERIEQEILLPGDDRFRLVRELKIPPGSYPITAGRDSELATFGGYWRGRATRWWVATRGERTEQNEELPSDWAERFRSQAHETRRVLLDWLDLWLTAGKNTEAMMHGHPEIDSILRDYINRQKPFILWAISGASNTAYAADFKASALDESARLFLVVMLHPLCARLNKCGRCKRFFLGRTARAKNIYCARRCGNADRGNRPSVNERERVLAEAAAKAMGQWKPRHGDRTIWMKDRINAELGSKHEHIKRNWVTLYLKEHAAEEEK